MTRYLDKIHTYDVANFNVVTGVTNYDVKTQNPGQIFHNVTQPGKLKIRMTGASIVYLRFNLPTNPEMPFTGGMSMQIFEELKYQNIYIRNESGATASFYIEAYEV